MERVKTDVIRGELGVKFSSNQEDNKQFSTRLELIGESFHATAPKSAEDLWITSLKQSNMTSHDCATIDVGWLS